MDPRVRERLEELAFELPDLLEGFDAQEPLSRERIPFILRERRSECVYVCVCERESVCEREKECVGVSERERDRVRVRV